MQLNCPRCKTEIPVSDINVQTMVAKCTHCSSVFGFAHLVPGAAAPYSKAAVEMPKSITLQNEGASLVLVRRWFSPSALVLLILAAGWDAFLVNWYLTLGPRSPIFFKVLPVVHVLVGIIVTYAALAMLLNKTRIRVSPGHVVVRHSPLPWRGNKNLGTMDLEQLYCEERVKQTKNGPSRSYAVLAIVSSGKRVSVCEGLLSPEQALFIEQKIETFLGISDKAVSGEYSRK